MKKNTLLDTLAPTIASSIAVNDGPFAPNESLPDTQKVIYVRVTKEARRAVSRLALELDTNTQQLVIEALNDLFVKYNRPPIVR